MFNNRTRAIVVAHTHTQTRTLFNKRTPIITMALTRFFALFSTRELHKYKTFCFLVRILHRFTCPRSPQTLQPFARSFCAPFFPCVFTKANRIARL